MKDFYQEKTDEISQRMDILLESVGASGLKPKSHQQQKSLVESITQRFEYMIHKASTLNESTNRRGSIPDLGGSEMDMEIQYSESLEGDLEKKEKKQELLRKSDSIKRAITDIYRTAKLLHNYSIMVSALYVASW